MRDSADNLTRAGLDLRALPVFAPNPALWTRILAAQHARTRRRRWLQGSFAAAAAIALLVTAWRLSGPLATVHDDLAATQLESRALQGQWRDIPDPGPIATAGMTRLRAIDATLQAAYDRGANEGEVAPLWQQRNRALRELIASGQTRSQSNRFSDITRI